MKTLKTLIKLNKNELDKLLRIIALSEKEKLRLLNRKHQIEEEAKQEIQKYFTSDYAYMLDHYNEKIRKIVRILDVKVSEISMYIGKMRQELGYQYADLKKFEIALENKQRIEQEKLKKKKL